MIIIIDEDMSFVRPLNKYTFAQYEEKFRDIGTFKIYARLEEANLYLLDRKKNYFVLFDNRVFGKIEYIEKDSDSQYEKVIQLSGKLANVLFTKRVIGTTVKFKGKSYVYIETLVKKFISENIAERYMNIEIQYDDKTLLDNKCSNIERQATGGYLWDEMLYVMELDRIGIEFYPVLNSSNGKTNISKWVLRICAGTNRTVSGDQSIILSQMMNNINQTSYISDRQKASGVVYAAGEGEGEERKWFVISTQTEMEKTGFNRSELWVDARDVQSIDSDGNTLTETQYRNKIMDRVIEKQRENRTVETYESTMNSGDKRYIYRKNIFLGDTLTVYDEELGNMQFNVQVVGAITSYEGAMKIVDLTLTTGYAEEKDIARQLKNNKANMEEVKTAVQYLLQHKSGGSGETDEQLETIKTTLNNLVTLTDTFKYQYVTAYSGGRTYNVFRGRFMDMGFCAVTVNLQEIPVTNAWGTGGIYASETIDTATRFFYPLTSANNIGIEVFAEPPAVTLSVSNAAEAFGNVWNVWPMAITKQTAERFPKIQLLRVGAQEKVTCSLNMIAIGRVK